MNIMENAESANADIDAFGEAEREVEVIEADLHAAEKVLFIFTIIQQISRC